MPINAPRTEGAQPKNPGPGQRPPSAHAPARNARGRKGRVVALGALFAVLLVGAVAGTCYVLWQQLELDHAARVAESTPVPEAVNDVPGSLADNPVDFAALHAQNPDIYAWIYVPGTSVNHPILLHPDDDSFYLNHNADGDWALEGAVFSESVNATDFSDPVTVLYGHYLTNGTMFSSLHEFEDPAFFEEHDTMYVYLPGRVLTYRIVSAYQYDDRHIVKTNDFSDPSVVQAYFDSVTAPTSEVSNVREGASLTDSDKIVQLSTCTSPTEDTGLRYLVTGVLVDEQQTA